MVTYGHDPNPSDDNGTPPGTAPDGPGQASMLAFTLAALNGPDLPRQSAASQPDARSVDGGSGASASEVGETYQPAGFRADESWFAGFSTADTDQDALATEVRMVFNPFTDPVVAAVGPAGVAPVDDGPTTGPIEIRPWPPVPVTAGPEPTPAAPVAVEIPMAVRVRRRRRLDQRRHDRLRMLLAVLIVFQLVGGALIIDGSFTRGPGQAIAAAPQLVPSASPGAATVDPATDPASGQLAGPITAWPTPVAVTATSTMPTPAGQAQSGPAAGEQATPAAVEPASPGPRPEPPPSPSRPAEENPPPPPPSPSSPPPSSTAPPPPAKPVIVSQAAGSASIQARGCPLDTTTAKAVVTSSAPLKGVALEMVEPASRRAQRVPMRQQGDSWVGTIGPAAAPGTIRWRVHAVDSQGGTASGPSQSIEVTAC